MTRQPSKTVYCLCTGTPLLGLINVFPSPCFLLVPDQIPAEVCHLFLNCNLQIWTRRETHLTFFIQTLVLAIMEKVSFQTGLIGAQSNAV